MTTPDHPLTVKWVLFGFRGRIGRKSFLLAALGMLLINSALLAYSLRFAEPASGTGAVIADGAGAALFGLFAIAIFFATAWALLALAVKRLHDLDLPAILGVVLVLPGIGYFAWLFLALMPSKQVTNRHGPPPFPKA